MRVISRVSTGGTSRPVWKMPNPWAVDHATLIVRINTVVLAANLACANDTCTGMPEPSESRNCNRSRLIGVYW
jgi:hypothetical protein